MERLHFFFKRIGTMNRLAFFSLSSSVEERAGVRSRSSSDGFMPSFDLLRSRRGNEVENGSHAQNPPRYLGGYDTAVHGVEAS